MTLKDAHLVEILEEINKSLKEINIRQQSDEMMSEPNQNLAKVERRVEHSTNQIQNSFDRIHDKVFNFNNILIATFMVLGTIPGESPILKIWTVIFPIANLMFLIWLKLDKWEFIDLRQTKKSGQMLKENNMGSGIIAKLFYRYFRLDYRSDVCFIS